MQDAAKTYPRPYVQVVAHTEYWCMLSNAGELSCDAYDLSNAPPVTADTPDGEFLVVDVNEKFGCAVRTTGEVQSWGRRCPSGYRYRAFGLSTLGSSKWHAFTRFNPLAA